MSSKSPTYGEQEQAPFRKPAWLRIVALLGFGGMVVMLLCLLSGCGSDSKPEAVSGKSSKAAASSKTVKSRGVVPLHNLGEVSSGNIKREPLHPDTEVAPGLTAGEVEKRMEAHRKRIGDPNFEVMPGITKRELDNKLAAEQKRQEAANSANQEILPGLTKQELDAKMAAHWQRTAMNNEALAGTTKEELNRKLETDRIRRELNREVSPGVLKDKLDEKLREAGKQ